MSGFLAKPLETLSSWVNPPQKKKLIYNLSEGSQNDEQILSRKAATLCEIHRLGFKVPPAFILSSEVSIDYHLSQDKFINEAATSELTSHMADLERATNSGFGATSGPQPLLLSVRGGALVSSKTLMSFEERQMDSVNTDIIDIMGAPDSWCIPGIKESCLGIGLNDEVAAHLATITNPFVAYNTYAHFLVRFGTIVMGAPRRSYRRILTEHVEQTGRAGMNLTEDDLKSIVTKFKAIVDIPDDPYKQLELAILEMYRCWFSPAAIEYRAEALNLAKETGTAVIVQSIVFGGTGVCFTRSPVSGIADSGAHGTFWSKSGEKLSLEEYSAVDPNVYNALGDISRGLEKHFRDMLQYEFVVGEDRHIYLLQVQSGKRSPKAAMKIAVDMVTENIMTEREALMSIDSSKVEFFLHRHLHANQLNSRPFGEGLAASRGVVTAQLAFGSAECLERSLHGDVIMCIREGMPTDARALRLAVGVLTIEGNLFTNTAILCRGMGKPCITCVKNLRLEYQGKQAVLVSANGNDVLRSGDIITLDGSSGKIFTGLQPTISLADDVDFQTVLSWADKFRKMRVDATLRPRSDLIDGVHSARRYGADGIGCVSTDGLFGDNADRLKLFQTALVHRGHPDAQNLLKRLCDMQKEDLRNIFRESKGRPISVKLLDRHLGAFLPTSDEGIMELAGHQQLTVAEIKAAVQQTRDKNPDIGLRGSRITAFYPEITEMQVRAIVSASLDLIADEGIEVCPNILVPMICTSHELDVIIELVNRIAFQVYEEYKVHNEKVGLVSNFYSIGAIYNSPRACLRAETIASKVASVAFNTEDLTMQTFGCDRDDAEKFFPQYIYDKIYLADPFKSIDDAAVGALMIAAIKKSVKAQPGIECSVIEGDHNTDPRSIDFFHNWGVKSISCAADRVPVARICAAQAAIRESNRAYENPEPDWEDYLFMY